MFRDKVNYMQTNLWDPVMFVSITLGFIILFSVIMYVKGLLWFQQSNRVPSDNWFIRFQQKDNASGCWYHRYGRPMIVIDMIVIFSYPVITYLDALSSFQLFVYIFAFFIPIQFILVILTLAIFARVNRQPDQMQDATVIVN